MTKTILTGLRSNASLTIGNYLGAILPMIKTQQSLEKDDKMFIFVPDLHSFITPIDYDNLYKTALQNIKTYIAAGIDLSNPNVYLYRQSRISAHSEIQWILSCFTYYGETQRMIQFKEKSKKEGRNVSVGLFSYPILMAGDILLYDADYVPLGQDQRQHLELTRDIAIRMNNKFEAKFPEGLFTVPKSWAKQLDFMNISEGIKIRSLSNPETKMSKSAKDPKGTITLTDKPDDAVKKIMSAQTDDYGKIDWNWEKQPGVTNLLQLITMLSGDGEQEVKDTWVGKTKYGELKIATAELVHDFLTNLQTKIAELDDEEVSKILEINEAEVSKIANKTLHRAQKAVGLKR